MSYQLVFQLPFSSMDDYDAMVQLENQIAEALGEHGEVDGHDCGSGETNIFVLTERPELAFDWVRRALWGNDLPSELRVAFRRLDGEAYTVLYPFGASSFDIA